MTLFAPLHLVLEHYSYMVIVLCGGDWQCMLMNISHIECLYL